MKNSKPLILLIFYKTVESKESEKLYGISGKIYESGTVGDESGLSRDLGGGLVSVGRGTGREGKSAGRSGFSDAGVFLDAMVSSYAAQAAWSRAISTIGGLF